MKKLIFLLFPVLLNAQIDNWTDKTADQLSNMTSGTTNIASKEYWVDNVFTQIRDLYEIYDRDTFTANDGTPAITDCNYYTTANTSSTAITNFDWGTLTAYTKTFYIYINDAYTTFTHADGTLDCGGTDLTTVAGDVMVVTYHPNETEFSVDFLKVNQ